MPPRAHDTRTLDLFEWSPPEELVRRYEPDRVRSATLRDRIARAVAETLKESDLDRDAIASGMAAWLGEEVSRNMLDRYASQAGAEHTIPFLRLLALVHVTGDIRLLQLGAELFGCAVVEDRWLPWVEVGQLADAKENIDRQFDAARRSARRTVKP